MHRFNIHTPDANDEKLIRAFVEQAHGEVISTDAYRPDGDDPKWTAIAVDMPESFREKDFKSVYISPLAVVIDNG